jgi:hypothetical protein
MVGTRRLELLTPTVSWWFGYFPALSTGAHSRPFDVLSVAFESTSVYALARSAYVQIPEVFAAAEVAPISGGDG